MMLSMALHRPDGFLSVWLLCVWLKLMANNAVFANLPFVLTDVRVGLDFARKRSSKARIKGWREIQMLMLNEDMIGFTKSIINMISIIIFIYSPSIIREVSYTKILRKKSTL